MLYIQLGMNNVYRDLKLLLQLKKSENYLQWFRYVMRRNTNRIFKMIKTLNIDGNQARG